MSREEIFKGLHNDCGKLSICNYKETGCGDCPIRMTFIDAEKTLCNENITETKTYEQGLEDAWELVRKIVLKAENGGLNYDDFVAIFGIDCYVHVLENMTPQEALAKLESYEKAQEEIKAGDVVKTSEGVEFVVSYIHENIMTKSYCGITERGMWIGGASDVKKTGKHIDISSILEQIGGI